MAREVWIHGRMACSGWAILGVYTRKSKAIHSCRGEDDFIAPVVLNCPLPEASQRWEGMEFPWQTTHTK